METATEMKKTELASGWSECRVPGKSYTLRPEEKAAQLGVSTSFLAQDRLRRKPSVDFARLGRLVRYSAN